MTIHDLKSWKPSFRDICQGLKTFEVRRNDRGYKVGDILLLREYDPETATYSGQEQAVQVTYILALEPWVPGFLGMSVQRGRFIGDAGATFVPDAVVVEEERLR